MKIKIDKKPIAKAKFDLIEFRKQMIDNFDLESSVQESVKVEESEIEDKDKILKLIFYGMDWGNVLMLFNDTRQDEIEIHVYRCHIKGLKVYNPESVEYEKMEFNFKDDIIDRVEFLVVNTGNPRFDKHMEYMLSQNLIDYVNFDWKRMFNLDKW